MIFTVTESNDLIADIEDAKTRVGVSTSTDPKLPLAVTGVGTTTFGGKLYTA
jgi:hypothetical protein